MKDLLNNWEWKKLGDVCDVKKGTSITKTKITDGNVPVIAGGQQPAYYHNVSNRNGENITISASGAYAGFVNYFDTPIFASDCTTVQSADKAQVSTKYVYYILKSLQQRIYDFQTGAGQPHIYAKDLIKIEIPVPPLRIQEKIVSILERAENLKQKRERVNEEADKIIQSIFYEMFGDPHTNEKKFELLTGDEVFVLSSGKFNPTKNLDDSYSYSTYGGNGVTGKSKEYLIDFDTLVIGRVGAYCGSVYKTSGKVWITDNAIYLKEFLRKVSLDYLLYFFKTQNLNKFAAQSGQPKITQKPIENMKIPLPPISLQNQFASIVEKIESIKQKQNQATKEINTLFDALMQKAFNGELI